MVMPSYVGVSKIHPVIVRPYTFDILNTVLCALNDPDQHATFTKQFYDRLSAKFRVVRFEEMSRHIGIEIEKNDSVGEVDIEEFVKKQFGYSIINCFSELLGQIPGFGNIPGDDALMFINDSFPVLRLPSSVGGNPVYHICFGI